MTMLNHFLEEAGIGDPDENLILVPGSSSQPSCQQDTAQSCSLARCEAQTQPQGVRWQDLPHLSFTEPQGTEQGQEELQQLPA